MVFAEFAKKRLFPTFKSGLLCAAMLMPVAALADSPVVNEETHPLIAASLSGTNGEIHPLIAAVVSNIGSKPRAIANQSAEPPKVVSLSQHIQRKYKVPEHKAILIVREAIINGNRHQVDPELILALIAVESTFRERAVSRVGARGLMQVMPVYHRTKVRAIGGSRALFDPAKNITTGSQILVTYLNNHSGDLRRALLNYNGSLGTRSSYADRVMQIYRDFQQAAVES